MSAHRASAAGAQSANPRSPGWPHVPGRRTGQGRAARAGSYEVTFARPVRARWTRRRGRQIRARAAEAPVRIWGQTEPGSPPGTVNARRLVVAGRRTDHPCQISDDRWRDRRKSPRVRGNRAGNEVAISVLRSIPARAGEPPRRPRPPRRRSVYPRACGGTQPFFDTALATLGLSPRVRGNHVLDRPENANAGSIPARAGEPRGPSWSPCRREVYPRACGGTMPPP